MPADGEAKAPSDALRAPPSRILVIDDDLDIINSLENLFEGDGHRVEAFVDAREGLKRFAEAPFDLVITDLVMPELSGWDVAETVKKKGGKVPVILITGWGDDLDFARIEKSGISQVIAKPFNMATVRKAVSEALPPPG
ncbi:MAG: response regulator [bacterium]